MTNERDIIITEVALRDGSHAVRHQYTVEQVRNIAKGLADANVPYIEVSHGDGLAGSSLQYGLSLVNEMELIEAAVDAVEGKFKIAALILPGIGTLTELKQAADLGAKMARVATHVTEADVAPQHIAYAKSISEDCGRSIERKTNGSAIGYRKPVSTEFKPRFQTTDCRYYMNLEIALVISL